MPNNSLAEVNQDLALVYTTAAERWNAEHPLGPWMEVNETVRTTELQTAYYAQNREPLAEVNRLRKLAGEGPITAAENSYKVTWAKAGQSPHFYRMALDVRVRQLVPRTAKTDPKKATVATSKGVSYVKGGIDWGGTNGNKYYIAFGGYMLAAERKLRAEGKIKIRVRWGHDWNGDGIPDKVKRDDPHYEVWGWAKIVADQHLASA